MQSYKSDRMRLVLVVSMQSIDTLQAGIALFEELGGNLREHSVGQDVFLLDGVLGGLSLQLVHLGLQRVGKAAGDGLLALQDKVAELLLDGSGSLAVVAMDQALELLGDHLVALTHDDVKDSLGANDLAGRGDQRRVTGILTNAGNLLQNILELVFLAGVLQLLQHVGEHATRNLVQQGVGIDAQRLLVDLAIGDVLLTQFVEVSADNIQLVQI